MLYPTKKQLDAFDVDEFWRILMSTVDTMRIEEQEAIMTALEHCHYKEDYWFLYQYIANPNIWRMPMVGIDSFIEDEFYLGKMTRGWKGVYPLLRQVARDIMEWSYNEVAAVCWLGSWKSFIASLVACYVTHHLLCLRNAHGFYKLIRDKHIGVINMGLTATQAQKVVFESIKNFVLNSEFFSQLRPVEKQGYIEFEKEMVIMMSGNSKASTQLWYNIFCAILDEASFYYEAAEGTKDQSNNEKTSVAQGIYEGLKWRIASRFWEHGLNMMISSPRTLSDFIMKKMQDAAYIDKATGQKMFPRIYGIQFPTWKVKDPSVYEGQKTFFFNSRNNAILTDPVEEIEKIHPVNKLSDPVFDYDRYVWEIPESFYVDFVKNPNKAKRDIWALPSEAIDGFLIPERIIFNMEREDPVLWNGKYKFPERPLRTLYYVHIDIGLNRNWVWDFTGFVMWHAEGFYKDEATNETRLKIKIDLVERIGVSPGKQEVDISEIRERIYTLKAMGYNIALVTLDQFQSKEMLQILKKKGIRAEYLSIDRTIDPYNQMKEAFYEQRLDVYYNEHLHRELVQLEEVYSWSHVKVDHPRTGSKDLSDALAGCVYNIMEHTPYSSWNVMTSMDPSKIDENVKIHLEEKHRLRDIEAKNRLVEKQNQMMERINARSLM